jgi:hypothetical protein
MRRLAAAAVCAFVLMLRAAPALADAVLDGNALLLDAIRAARLPPPAVTRLIALLNVAVFDSVNAASGMPFQPYGFDGAPVADADSEQAAAAAAALVIGETLPDLPAPLAARLAGLAPDSRTAGAALGRSRAAALLRARRHDGADTAAPFAVSTAIGAWRPTPPGNAPALLPGWGKVRPWAIPDPVRFRPAGPPAVGSVAWIDSFNAVKSLGTDGTADHRPDMTATARFWDDDAGTATLPGHWLDIAMGIAARRHQGLADNARMFALLGITLADVAVVVWDTKYRFAAWRPVTAIREASRIGNPRLLADRRWTPVLATPAFPEYPSGHSAFSAAAARVLALCYGSDMIAVEVKSSGGAVRHFDRLSDAAEEAGLSRIYGGIHFYFSHVDGAATGRLVAEHVFATRLQPRK